MIKGYFSSRGDSNGPWKHWPYIIGRVMNENLKKKTRKRKYKNERQSNERRGGNHKRAKQVITKDVALPLPPLRFRVQKTQRDRAPSSANSLLAKWKGAKPAGRRSPLVRVRLPHTHISKCPNRERRKRYIEKKRKKKNKSLVLLFFSWYSRDCARGRDAIEFSTHRINRQKKKK